MKAQPGGDVGQFFAQGLAPADEADGVRAAGAAGGVRDGGWDGKPYVATMRQLAAVANAMAAAVDTERRETAGGYSWGHIRLGADKVKAAFGAMVLGQDDGNIGGAAAPIDLTADTDQKGEGDDEESRQNGAQALPLVDLLMVGRLHGHGVTGGIVLTDATGKVPVAIDGTNELEACHAEHLWLVGGFSLVVEYAPASSTRALSWYFVLDLPSAACLFQDSRPQPTIPAAAAAAAVPAQKKQKAAAATADDAFASAYAAAAASAAADAVKADE